MKQRSLAQIRTHAQKILYKMKHEKIVELERRTKLLSAI